MTEYAPAPPDQTVWWDTAAVTAAVLDVLRLTDTDVDAARIEALVPVAGARINDYLDRDPTDPVTDPAPAPLTHAMTMVTVNLYRAKDAPPSSIDGLLAASWRPASVDPLADVRAIISPYRARFGVG